MRKTVFVLFFFLCLALLSGCAQDSSLSFYQQVQPNRVIYLTDEGIYSDPRSEELLSEPDARFFNLKYLRSKDLTSHYTPDGVLAVTTKTSKIVWDTTKKILSLNERRIPYGEIRLRTFGEEVYISMADLNDIPELAAQLRLHALSSEPLYHSGRNDLVTLSYTMPDSKEADFGNAFTRQLSSKIYTSPEEATRAYALLQENGRKASDHEFSIIYDLEKEESGHPDIYAAEASLERDGVDGVRWKEPVTKVALSGGQIGYLLSAYFRPSVTPGVTEEEDPSFRLPEKLVLVWEAVYSANPDTAKIPAMKPLNVISPTWFDLIDAQGGIADKSSRTYVDWAKKRGYEVWPAITNSFKPAMTNEFLKSYHARQTFIREVVQRAAALGVSGINIDFEHIFYADKDSFSNFVNELCYEGHKNGLTMSIDVNVPGGAPDWSLFYDHKVLGTCNDYVIVMTYDQHYASGEVAGPVAGFDWVKKHMTTLTKIVPPEKLVLGLPFYTRVWRESPDPDNPTSSKLKSVAVGMHEQNRFVESNHLIPIWDEQQKLHTVTFYEGDTLVSVWMEDAASISEKIKLVDELSLGGVAGWRRGYETPDIWNVLEEVNSK